MDIGAISTGPNPPQDIHVIIEIPLGGTPVKYELDKKSGALMVDRFLHTARFYPGNYGSTPQTLSDDGDPCDVLVVSQVQVVPGAVVRCRPVGALVMKDEAGGDEKIIAVPVDALAPHYKDLEKGKWVTIVKWLDVKAAEQLVLDAITRAALASEASGQRGDSMVRAHSASEDARERADDTRPEPGSSARADKAQVGGQARRGGAPAPAPRASRRPKALPKR